MSSPSSVGVSSPVGPYSVGGVRARRDVADEELVGHGLEQQAVDIAQVAPEQVVELEIVLGGMVVAVPPEPVAPFRDEHFLAGACDGAGIGGPGRLERLARIGQLAPGALIVAMADPDVEVRVDPRTREDAGQVGFRAPARLAHRDGPKLRMGGEPPVQGAQKRSSAPLEMLPGIFAVEDDENDRLSPPARGR